MQGMRISLSPNWSRDSSGRIKFDTIFLSYLGYFIQSSSSMNLRRAILRKAYNNQTFCSYSFKNFKDKYGRTLITISRSSHSSHKLEIETQETIDLSMKASSSHKYKRNVETPHSKICQAEKARRESRDDGKKQKISSSHQLNRFDQYLVDRKFMK